RRIEMQVSRGMNEAQQLATTPLLHTAVTEANRTYEGKDTRSIQGMIKDWQQRWRQRDQQSEFPLFINRIVTNYLIRWHDIRKSDYIGILVTDNQGALVVSSIPQVEYFYGKTSWRRPFWTIQKRRSSGRLQYCCDEIRSSMPLPRSPSERLVTRCCSVPMVFL